MKLTRRQLELAREVAAMAPRCNGKRRFDTQRDAVASGASRTRKGAPRLRVYRCPDCAGFHLTKRAGGGRRG